MAFKNLLQEINVIFLVIIIFVNQNCMLGLVRLKTIKKQSKKIKYAPVTLICAVFQKYTTFNFETLVKFEKRQFFMLN